MPLPLAALGLLGGSALAGGLSSAFSKSPKMRQVPKLTPQQQQAQNQVLQQALSGLQNPYAGFEPLANQARQQFNTQTVPTLAERFTALGGQGGQRSSAFSGALGQAGTGLESDLAALQAQYGLQNRSQLLQMLGIGLEPQFENAYEQGRHTPVSGALSGLQQGLGALGGAQLMGGLGGQSGLAGLLQNIMPSAQQQGAAQTVQSMFAPQRGNIGQQRFNQFVGSGGNQLGSRFFNPMTQGY